MQANIKARKLITERLLVFSGSIKEVMYANAVISVLILASVQISIKASVSLMIFNIGLLLIGFSRGLYKAIQYVINNMDKEEKAEAKAPATLV